MTQELGVAIEDFEKLTQSVKDFHRQIKDASEIISRQTKIIDLLFDVVIKLADDADVDLRVRRRLAFALQQVRGIGMPS